MVIKVEIWKNIRQVTDHNTEFMLSRAFEMRAKKYTGRWKSTLFLGELLKTSNSSGAHAMQFTNGHYLPRGLAPQLADDQNKIRITTNKAASRISKWRENHTVLKQNEIHGNPTWFFSMGLENVLCHVNQFLIGFFLTSRDLVSSLQSSFCRLGFYLQLIMWATFYNLWGFIK